MTTLFHDEQSAYDKAIASGVSDADIMNGIKKRRLSLTGGSEFSLNADEVGAMKKMSQAGISSSDAIGGIMKRREQQKQEKYDALPMWKKAGLQTTSAGVGALSTVGSSAMNIGGWVADKLGFNETGKEMKDFAGEISQAGEDTFGKDKQLGSGYTAGNLIGGTAAMLSAPTLGGTATSTLGKVGLGATNGALQMGATDIALNGETSAGTVVGGALLGGGLPILGKGLSKAKETLTQKLPQRLVSSGLMTPSKLEAISKKLDDTYAGRFDVTNTPKWLLENNVSGSKEVIQEKLVNIAKVRMQEKAQLLGSYKNTYSSSIPEVKELGEAMMELLPSYAKVTKDGIMPRAGNSQKVNEILEFVTNPSPTIAEIEKARLAIGSAKIFSPGGGMVDDATKEGLQNVWRNLTNWTEKQAPGLRKINQDIAVSQAIREAVGKKEARDLTRELLSLPNIVSAGIGGGYGAYNGGDLQSTLVSAGFGIGIRGLLNSPYITTNVANFLKKKGGGLQAPTLKNKAFEGAKNKLLAPTLGVIGQDN